MEAVNPADSGGHRAADRYLEPFTPDNIINTLSHCLAGGGEPVEL
jgi:hypothetical protein